MDAVAFMDWKRVVPWKVLSIKARPQEPLVPVGFGGRNPKLYDALEPGSQIWVVTRIANEFSLAGRLTVKDVINRDSMPKSEWPKDIADLCAQWKFVARSEPSKSEFFETNQAQAVMDQHNIRFSQNRTIVYKKKSLKDSFQACMNQGRETVFLSYVWQGGRRFAFSLAKEFRRRGMSPWLDAMALPKYQLEGNPAANKARLTTLLKYGIEKSKIAVVINTEGYTTSDWTKLELNHSRNIGIPCFQVLRPGGRMLQCNKPPVSQTRVGDIAQEIIELSANHQP